VKCPRCGYKNQKGTKICSLCGALLIDRHSLRRTRLINSITDEMGKKCKRCGLITKTSSIFCPACGGELVLIKLSTLKRGEKIVVKSSKSSVSLRTSVAMTLTVTLSFAIGLAIGVYFI